MEIDWKEKAFERVCNASEKEPNGRISIDIDDFCGIVAEESGVFKEKIKDIILGLAEERKGGAK